MSDIRDDRVSRAQQELYDALCELYPGSSERVANLAGRIDGLVQARVGQAGEGPRSTNVGADAAAVRRWLTHQDADALDRILGTVAALDEELQQIEDALRERGHDGPALTALAEALAEGPAALDLTAELAALRDAMSKYHESRPRHRPGSGPVVAPPRPIRPVLAAAKRLLAKVPE